MTMEKLEKPGMHSTTEEWRKWKEKKKDEQKKRNEEKMLKKMAREEEGKRQKLDEERSKVDDTQIRQQKGRHYTVSVAVPSSIMTNAQSPQLQTHLAGQVARACSIFNIDEIVIFDETDKKMKDSRVEPGDHMMHILQYLECPQYLRKAFFPPHEHLRFAGLLHPLDAPHHLRKDEEWVFREGVVTDQPVKEGFGSFVDVGLDKPVQIDKLLQPGIRVTVRKGKSEADSKKSKGSVVSPDSPREDRGLYWGYQVRRADRISAVFDECPFEGGYDLTIGTSDRGDDVDHISFAPFKHGLIAFGGVYGLEACLEADEKQSLSDPRQLFGVYLNTCPNQGSRTIRTEEAILTSMAALRPKLIAANK